MAATTPLTLEAFLGMPDIDERRLELIDGEVYEKVSPRWGHGRLAFLVAAALDENGFASVEPRAIIPESDDRGPSAPLPGIAFYRTDPPAPEDWIRVPPDVAVEVLSPGQSRAEVRAKADMYVAFGVRSVWVVDSERRMVDIYADGRGGPSPRPGCPKRRSFPGPGSISGSCSRALSGPERAAGRGFATLLGRHAYRTN